jgi:hypothetical protein
MKQINKLGIMKTIIKPFHLFLIPAFILSLGNTNKYVPDQKNDYMLKFEKLGYIDIQGTGLEAFSFLMPSDWKFVGGIKWNPEQVAMPGAITWENIL